MLQVSEAFHEAFMSDSRQIRTRVTIGERVFGNDNITSFELDYGSMDGDSFAIGSAFANSFKITFSELVEGLQELDEIEVEMGIILPNESTEYVPMGTFIINEEVQMDRNNNKTSLEAMDKMIMLGGTYEPSLSGNASIRAIALDIANKAGVDVADSINQLRTDSIEVPEGYTLRDAFGLIAQFEAGYAIFNRDGKLEIRELNDPEFRITPENYISKGLVKNETFYRLGGIQAHIDKTVSKIIQSGSRSGSQILLRNNAMNITHLNRIYQELQSLSYYPYTLNWFGNPALEAGDWIEIEDLQGNRFKTPNLSYTLEFNGGLKATSKAETKTTNENVYPEQSSFQKQLDDLRNRNGNYWQVNNVDSGTPNMLAGNENNDIPQVYEGSTIGGGGSNSRFNRIFSDFSTISGGEDNLSHGDHSTIAGGENNQVGSDTSEGDHNSPDDHGGFVGGGKGNYASGGSIGGGVNNNVFGGSSIGAGHSNFASQQSSVGSGVENSAYNRSTISGGEKNRAFDKSSIGGGIENEAYTNSSISGGKNNLSIYNSFIGAGEDNRATSEHTVIGGGKNNGTHSEKTVVGGGENNLATGQHATVAGGLNNQANVNKSTIAGGENNRAVADYSSILGGKDGFAMIEGSQAHAVGSFGQGLSNQTLKLIIREQIDGSGIIGINDTDRVGRLILNGTATIEAIIMAQNQNHSKSWRIIATVGSYGSDTHLISKPIIDVLSDTGVDWDLTLENNVTFPSMVGSTTWFKGHGTAYWLGNVLLTQLQIPGQVTKPSDTEIEPWSPLKKIKDVETTLKNLDLDDFVTDNDLTNYATIEYVDSEIAIFTDWKQEVEQGFISVTEDMEELSTRIESKVNPEDLEGFATMSWVSEQLSDIDVNLDDYATIDWVQQYVEGITGVDLSEYAKLTDVPDVSEFVTEEEVNQALSILTEYATKDWVDLQISELEIEIDIDLSEYAKFSDIPDVSEFVTQQELSEAIPDVSNFVTEEEIDGKLNNVVTNEQLTTVKNELNARIDTLYELIAEYLPEPELINIEGSKIWNDANNQDGIRPSSVIVRLFANDIEMSSLEVSSETNWQYIFEDLPETEKGVLINYTIGEIEVEGYSTEYDDYNIINSYSPSKIDLTIKKVWQDGDNIDGIRPNTATIKLLKDEEETDKEIVLNENNNWQGSFNDLDEYQNGEKINYSVIEVNVHEEYESNISGDMESGYIVTNSYTPIPPEDYPSQYVSDSWNDGINLYIENDSIDIRMIIPEVISGSETANELINIDYITDSANIEFE